MDAIVIGSGTAMYDNPLLTVRLDESDRCGNKIPCRVVLDRSGNLSPRSQLVQTAGEVPVLIITATSDTRKIQQWEANGCEVFNPFHHHSASPLSIDPILENFAARRWTHILVEGGRQILGAFFDAQCMDEVHAFIAPKLIGGTSAIPVIGGEGIEKMSLATLLESPEIKIVGQDIYVRGRRGQ